MNDILKEKVIAGALLILSIATFFMPIVRFDDISISIFDMARVSSDITDLMDEFGAASELIGKGMDSYFVFSVLLLVLPIIECIVLFMIKGRLSFVAGIAGTMVNNVIAYMFLDQLNELISMVNKAISFFSMSMEIETVASTKLVWLILYLLILGVSIFGLLQRKLPPLMASAQGKRSNRGLKTMKDMILPEEIGAPASAPQRQRPSHALSQASALSEAAQTEPVFHQQTEQAFWGGLIGKTGLYKDKARLFEPNENVLIGTDQNSCDILLSAAFDDRQDCVLRYDAGRKEYQLTPIGSKDIFLECGQPLGAGRVYCLPRGTVLMIRDESNMFQLA